MIRLEEVVRASTLSSVGQGYTGALRMSPAVMPIGFALVGGLTGASASAFPSELIDWTSADVIDLARPFSLREHVDVAPMIQTVPPATVSPVKRQLDEIKSRSRLTWGQIAEAMGVDARTIHLWRGGGGISAGHEERLQELAVLIDSIDIGDPADVRSELLQVAPKGALLERLRSGESPRELQAAALWRPHALESLERNMAEWQGDGVLDEDFVFLLYLQPDEVERFAAEARELLNAPGVTRREWEALLDVQFAQMRQPEPVAVEAAEEKAFVDDDFGIPPLFKPAELGIALGVGAIASRRPLHEVR